jgi:hypothetical protein
MRGGSDPGARRDQGGRDGAQNRRAAHASRSASSALADPHPAIRAGDHAIEMAPCQRPLQRRLTRKHDARVTLVSGA